MIKVDMKKYGLTKRYYNESDVSHNQKVGRIVQKTKDTYKVITNTGTLAAEISDRFEYGAGKLAEYPVVGDFVIVEINQQGFNSTVLRILKRKNELMRKGEWEVNYDHIVASNIDTIFICISLDNDFNTEKLKTYISIATKCKAEPVLVLTECDSFNNIDSILNNIKEHTQEMDVIVTSRMDKDDCKSVKDYIQDGKTVVFTGPEHDKIRMINKLFRDIHFENDLVLLPEGGVLINTPEMRELGIISSNTTKKFAELH